jgi:hypothetical protein
MPTIGRRLRRRWHRLRWRTSNLPVLEIVLTVTAVCAVLIVVVMAVHVHG